MQAEILYLQRYSTNFRNLRLSSKMLRVGIWVESFRCAGILLLQWQGENLVHRQHLKFCHFQSVHCASRNPISPKIFNQFSKSSPPLEVVVSGHLGGKFQVRRYFAFAMAWLKLCASTTFEILLISTCTLWQQKSYISKCIHPIFEIFPSARRCWRWAFGWKVSGAQVFYFCNDKVKLWASTTFEVLLLSTCTLCQQKSYISKGIQPIFEIFASARRRWGRGIWIESFMGAGILLLQWEGEIFAHRKHLKFCHFQPVHSGSQNPVSPKGFNRFSKSFRRLEDVEGGHLGEKFQVRRYFTFVMAKRKLCTSTTFQILPLSTCALCQQKSYISKGIHPIFEIFPSARRCWRWAFRWKVSGAQVFCFCNGKVKTGRIDNIWNFATINLYTLPAKILYLQRYSTDFRNLSVSSKTMKLGIWVESFRCACILLLQWQGENFAHRQHLKFCHYQPVHCASKNPISPKVFNRFSKSWPHLEDFEGGHLRGIFQVRR